MSKTASGLVKYAKAQLGKPYWYGTFGQKSSEALYKQKKKQYPSYYTATDFKNQYGKKVHDCIGLIKGYMWCDSPTDTTPNYASNGMGDMNEEMMYNNAKTKGAISSMPDVPGICVLFSGHIGVYIGDGYVIEARGHAYGVVKTKLKDRPWTKWCKCPYITYDTEKKTQKKTSSKTATKYVRVSTNGSVLRCRKRATTLSGIVGSFKNGTKLTLIEKTNKNWYKVKGISNAGKSITGYCSVKWLKEL